MGDPAIPTPPDTPSRLLPLVYSELRSAAGRLLTREAPGHSLQPTALVHEAYLRVSKPGAQDRWNGSAHFRAVVVEVMRRILVESARRKKRLKRGGAMTRLEVSPEEIADTRDADTILALNDALAALARVNAHWAEVVNLRYFLGLTVAETAAALGVSPRTADVWWASAREWLKTKLAIHLDEAVE